MNKRMPTPYPQLNVVLQAMVQSVQTVLGTHFIGAYLQGSFAIGDFDTYSDVDFIIVIENELSNEQVAALQLVHKRIFDPNHPWAQYLEGSYFPKAILRDPTRIGEALWFLNNGSDTLELSDHCNTQVVRWAVREKGVTLAGPPPKTLVDPITPAMLRAEIADVILEWGAQILATDGGYYHSHFYQGYFVLNFCRMLHDLRTGTNGSKVAGAEWAKRYFDASWSDLIDRAWLCRPNPEITVRQPADPEDYARTMELIQMVMDECKLYLNEAGRID